MAKEKKIPTKSKGKLGELFAACISEKRTNFLINMSCFFKQKDKRAKEIKRQFTEK